MTMHNNSILNYADKPDAYFAGSRSDYVLTLPDNPDACILEVGCGHGETGAQALSMGKCRRYIGIDIEPSAADMARQKLSDVILGDIEKIDLPFPEASFDALILSEVLEHLVDPWAALRRLSALLKPGALVFASSPNISHYRVILNLLRGDWTLQNQGVMDRTHLRWFTPELFSSMFNQAGIEVLSVEPLVPFGRRTVLLNQLTANKYRHLFMRQINLHGRRLATTNETAAKQFGPED